jgi:RNA recognition motif-containing protein
MGKRLYVGNLPFDADEDGLRDLFAQDGRQVERVHIVIDRETQRPRGFAFVEMGSDEQARAAIAALDGSLYGTRAMRISEAEDRRGPGGPGGPGGPRPGGGRPEGSRSDGPRPAGPRAGAPGGGAPGSGGAGSGGVGPRGPGGGARSDGPPRSGGGDDRAFRFGPDARPKRERDKEFGKKPKRRLDGGEGDDDFGGGRRGGFDDDDEY